MHEIRTGVMDGVTQETVCSEASLCIIVQHEVAQQLASLLNDRERSLAVEQSAQEAILGVFGSSVPFHSYAVAEGTRGVLHGLVCTGLDISYITHPALRGIHQALVQVNAWTPDNEAGMREGLRSALEDLGMTKLSEDHSLDLPEYFRAQTARFGASYY